MFKFFIIILQCITMLIHQNTELLLIKDISKDD